MNKRYMPEEVREILKKINKIQGQAYCAFDREKAEEAEQLFNAVMGAIGSLNKEEKDVINCLYRDEASWGEAAERLFISENTVSRRKTKAIQNICNILNGEVI